MARPKPAKITKSASSSPYSTRSMKHQGRSASAGTGAAALQKMVNEVETKSHVASDQTGKVGVGRPGGNEMADTRESGEPQSIPGKGKGRLVQAEEIDPQPFPILDLPAEIRLEIYRMTLTRSHKILLSKLDKTHLKPGASSPDEATAQDTPTVHAAWTAASMSAAPAAGSVNSTGAQSAAASNSMGGVANGQLIVANSTASRTARRPALRTGQLPSDHYSRGEDPLNVNLLRTCKQIYKEARDVLYSENVFDINIYTAVSSLAALHQRSRRHIKHIELEIPTYTEILEHFSEVVRLSLRYCAGLNKFVIHTPFTLPGADGGLGTSNTTVYANGFDILRWLPQQCQVVLTGNPNPEIDTVVKKHLKLAKAQDKMAYARRQLISNEAENTLDA